MNPILIKPSTDTGAQIVVLGRVWGQVSASDYHLHRVEELFPVVLESYQKLAAEHDIIVIEGAGSPAEINLRAHDIVNMRMAEAADAACLLVGDIDRGGVFASIYGTFSLLEPGERARAQIERVDPVAGAQERQGIAPRAGADLEQMASGRRAHGEEAAEERLRVQVEDRCLAGVLVGERLEVLALAEARALRAAGVAHPGR